MKTVVIIKFLFAGIGVALLAGALYWRSHVTTFVQEASVAQGTVTELRLSRSSDSRSYYPVVRFAAADGTQVEFVSSTGSNPPSYAAGERVEVLYKPANPRDAMINGFLPLWLGPIIVGGMGTIFLLIGGTLIVLTGSGERRLARLRASGTPVVTRLQGVEVNEGISVNGRHPWRIVTQWHNPATSEIHVFHSANLWYDPTDHLKSQDITVYIEPSNPRRYAMDVAFLPRLAAR